MPKFNLNVEFDNLEELRAFLNGSSIATTKVVKAETPKAEIPETPKAETPKAETPKAEIPETAGEVTMEMILPVVHQKIQGGHKAEIAKYLKEIGVKQVTALTSDKLKPFYDFLNNLGV